VDLYPGDLSYTVIVVAGRMGIVEIDPAALKAARRHARISQRELAARIGHSGPDAISKYERGRHRPDVATLTRIAAALNVPIRQLLRPDVPHSLRVLRICAGLTQDQVAGQLVMSRAAWSDVERGQRDLADAELGPVAQVLGVAPEDIAVAADVDGNGPLEAARLSGSLLRRYERHRRDGETLRQFLDRIIPE
jgi:transcriptional regulator with XRE-family HTH domain